MQTKAHHGWEGSWCCGTCSAILFMVTSCQRVKDIERGRLSLSRWCEDGRRVRWGREYETERWMYWWWVTIWRDESTTCEDEACSDDSDELSKRYDDDQHQDDERMSEFRTHEGASRIILIIMWGFIIWEEQKIAQCDTQLESCSEEGSYFAYLVMTLNDSCIA